jgi:hypothetical protein
MSRKKEQKLEGFVYSGTCSVSLPSHQYFESQNQDFNIMKWGVINVSST